MITVAKVPTTPENRALGTVRGLRRALGRAGTGRRRRCRLCRARHDDRDERACIQRSGGRIAFITNEGFRDLLLIGRQNRPSLYDIRKTRPAAARRARGLPHRARPARPGRATRSRRSTRTGCAVSPSGCAPDRVAAVAICLLHAYANPAHERRAQRDPHGGAARRPGLHLDRHPRRIPRIRARQHGRAERLPAAGHGALSRLPDRAARRSGRGAGARARRAGHGHGGVGRA